mgnify:CR=1 FL=1
MAHMSILDDQDGKPMREYSKYGCPHCVSGMIYIGHGDYKEEFDCYCQTVIELFTPRPGELCGSEKGLGDKEKAEVIERVSKEPRYMKDGFVCIGGIGSQGRCHGRGPGKDCPYCFRLEDGSGSGVRRSQLMQG